METKKHLFARRCQQLFELVFGDKALGLGACNTLGAAFQAQFRSWQGPPKVSAKSLRAGWSMLTMFISFKVIKHQVRILAVSYQNPLPLPVHMSPVQQV